MHEASNFKEVSLVDKIKTYRTNSWLVKQTVLKLLEGLSLETALFKKPNTNLSRKAHQLSNATLSDYHTDNMCNLH